jgi:hypothetical protein
MHATRVPARIQCLPTERSGRARTSLDKYAGKLKPRMCAEVAQLVVGACFSRGLPRPITFAQTAQQHNLSLRPGILLSSSATIFWDCLCAFLSDSASHHGTEAACALGAAAAAKGVGAMQHLDALDIICSEPLNLLQMVAEHVKASEPQCAASCRLMATAQTCVHFGDSAARAEAEALCSELVTLTFTLRCRILILFRPRFEA